MPVSYITLRFALCLAFTFIGLAPSSSQTNSVAFRPKDPDSSDIHSHKNKPERYKPMFITNLSPGLSETSGMVYIEGQLWTINDGGNPAGIYQIDTSSGRILRTVVVSNAVNTDWESITQDESNVYVGDFGNNSGNRTDLCILKIPKSAIFGSSNDTVQAGFIHFSYPDQVEFTRTFYHSDYDCEAFFYQNDSLHLFTKDWLDQQTKHYVVTVDTGIFKARLVEKFNAEGLITDASMNDKGNIVLLGYKNKGGRFYRCFAWLLSDYKEGLYFSGRKYRVDLGSAIHLGQSEGIVLRNDDSGWISSESIRAGWLNHPAKLFYFSFSDLYFK